MRPFPPKEFRDARPRAPELAADADQHPDPEAAGPHDGDTRSRPAEQWLAAATEARATAGTR